MKNRLTTNLQSWLVLLVACTFGMLLAPNARAAGIIYTETDLVSDLPGALTLDPFLLNAWGIAFLPGSPLWVNANGGGTSNLYDGQGVIIGALPRVTIPPPTSSPAGTLSAPTGIVSNSTSGFDSDLFIFDSEDGIISGWQLSDGLNAVIRVDNSTLDNPNANAVYKGLAIAKNSKGKLQIYATNFRQGTVDVFDASYNPVLPGKFQDKTLPTGYAPFNIALINGQLYVTYALQDAEKHDDVSGSGHGYINVFTTDGVLVRRFASNGPLNSPWGITLAPKNFGSYSGKILVGNFGSGLIWAYDPTLGRAPLGQLWTHTANSIVPLVIDGLWSLTDATGALNATKNALYFSAGPNGESDGLFGTITAP